VAAVACMALQLIYLAKACLMGARACWLDYSNANPPYAAGCMALMAVANWAHMRGASSFATVLWTTALVSMLFGQGIFLRGIALKLHARSTSSQQPPAPAPATAPTMWSIAAVPWIVPLVGVSAAAATGGAIISWAAQSYGAKAVALYGPLALGGMWACVVLVPLYAKVSQLSLWHEPPTAILMAPAALNMVGWLGATSALDSSRRNSWPTHVLAVGVVVFALPPMCSLPRILDPRRPFSPALATIGFPAEIVAIALVRYHAVLRQAGAGSADAWRVLAWSQLLLATAIACAVLGRFLLAAIRALRRLA